MKRLQIILDVWFPCFPNYIYGNGSGPPLFHGWHFKILFAAKNKALKKLYFFKASIVYSEHDGVNLQEEIKKGLIALW